MMKIKKSTFLSLSLSITSLFLTTPVAAAETVRSLGVKTASWYGKPFHGRIAADGSRFNMYQSTAAHRTLPFGTKLKVTCVKTGKSTVVTVTDRGPFHGNRALDLSYGAAKALGMLDRGITKVKIEIYKVNKSRFELIESRSQNLFACWLAGPFIKFNCPMILKR